MASCGTCRAVIGSAAPDGLTVFCDEAFGGRFGYGFMGQSSNLKNARSFEHCFAMSPKFPA